MTIIVIRVVYFDIAQQRKEMRLLSVAYYYVRVPLRMQEYGLSCRVLQLKEGTQTNFHSIFKSFIADFDGSLGISKCIL